MKYDVRMVAVVAVSAACSSPTAAQSPRCDDDNAGLELPAGFCALVAAEGVYGARHMAVTPNGDLFVTGGDDGGLLAMRDEDGDGRFDGTARIVPGRGSDVILRGESLYFSDYSSVYRYSVDLETMQLSQRETIVSGMPDRGGHAWGKSMAIDASGNLFVNVGSRTNSCQVRDRIAGSPGNDPCTERQTRAGVWRFNADAVGQEFGPEHRFATGLRNTIALTVRSETDALYGVVHGRDQLYQNWGELFSVEQSAENPAEEFVRIEEGDDFGWPYCFYSNDADAKVLSPEYGGDGTTVGRCEDKKDPVVAFPGHWAPDGVLFYEGEQFPQEYRGGAFIAFHGSWNRAPLPQEGYNVVFVPFNGDNVGEWRVFAEGFRGSDQGRAAHRPVDVVQGPDGSIYVSDDAGGRIYRILYRP